ncbi:MAG: hypothetical protein ACLS4Z_02895 [Christensenellaceae bacterium]
MRAESKAGQKIIAVVYLRAAESTAMPFREEKAADETPLPYKNKTKKSPRERFP